ncbi:30S ribosomal protein S6 [Candidatus Aerophobetes bacterium]|uniref:Small ribosomal subunit protein bS6 n=1 Tax=Aerophobetes bacterium TaxID=2030807 RepID=A0A2A4X7E9_UNCAE|nr:MAG: 30S ribosomal protein S6 [Candidatus Aerophobetes bacterium]
MSTKANNLYEGMHIISASLSEGALEKAVARLKSTIEEFGGEIKNVISMGRKKLAYEINNARHGEYFLIYFSAPPSAIVEIKKEYKINEDLMRVLIFKTEAVQEKIEFQTLGEVS